jgi:hypothetical protein
MYLAGPTIRTDSVRIIFNAGEVPGGQAGTSKPLRYGRATVVTRAMN